VTDTLGVIDPPAPTSPLVRDELRSRLPEAETDDFVELFRSQYRRVVTAMRLAGAGADSEDVAQEAFARTYRHWRRVRHGSSPAGYVFRVAFRQHAKRGGVREVVVAGNDLLQPVAPSPEDAVLTTSAVASAIAKMPPARRSCAVACWLAGLRAEEAATAFGISAATVRKQLERARADLAPYL